MKNIIVNWVLSIIYGLMACGFFSFAVAIKDLGAIICATIFIPFIMAAQWDAAKKSMNYTDIYIRAKRIKALKK